jgi:predicted nucleic acid-binding protein
VEEDMVMVTENVDDFKNIRGIRIENWVDRTKK